MKSFVAHPKGSHSDEEGLSILSIASAPDRERIRGKRKSLADRRYPLLPLPSDPWYLRLCRNRNWPPISTILSRLGP